MKRYILLAIMCLISEAISAQYDLYRIPQHKNSENYLDNSTDNLEWGLFDFQANRCTYLGVGYNSCDDVGGVNFLLSCYGIYIDYSANSEGNYSSYTGIDVYDGYNTSSWHIGYSIPITSSFKITPLIGSVDWMSGYWDGGDWWVTNDGIQNNFVPTATYKEIDFGINISYSFTNYTNWGFFIYANLSKYNIGGGIGFVIGN